MAIAILVGRDDTERNQYAWFVKNWREALLAIEPQLDVRIWPAVGNIAEIDYVLVWNHPMGALKKFNQAKAIACLSAGVDHLFVDQELDPAIPIVRLIDAYMAKDILHYVVVAVLQYVKRMSVWQQQQLQHLWIREPPFSFSGQTIGVMGLGYLGGQAAQALQFLGLNVIGWSSSPKQWANLKTYAGPNEFADFLAQANILICMLPLTSNTKNILNQTHFSQLPKGAYLINVGRGEHLVESDLLTALDTGQLSGACLDVFRVEPLPSTHPFWGHPCIQVTPHIASVTNAHTAAMQVLDNYHRALSGQPLLNTVDMKKQY